MSEIDWSKAPEGATHYMPEGDVWTCGFWKKEDGGNYFHGGDEWRLTFADPFHNPRLISRPTDQPWTGEGLPPVGTELECGFACEGFRTWHKGVCVAVGIDPEDREEICVVKSGEKIAMYTPNSKRMRPIRTPEQIAAEEREKAIAEMADAARCSGMPWLERFGVLYDAGYRKQEQPK